MSQQQNPVFPENPCPFLRALAAGHYIKPDLESVSLVAQIIGEAAGGTKANKTKVRTLSIGIAAIANGLSLSSIISNFKSGLKINRLRGGPLDKKGIGSQIISQNGRFNPEQFERLKQFSREFKTDQGIELGLSLKELNIMMDRNFERATHSRPIDRKLMNGEWPVLLKLMKKGQGDDAYLSLDELRALFAEYKLPKRIEERIAQFQGRS